MIESAGGWIRAGACAGIFAALACIASAAEEPGPDLPPGEPIAEEPSRPPESSESAVPEELDLLAPIENDPWADLSRAEADEASPAIPGDTTPPAVESDEASVGAESAADETGEELPPETASADTFGPAIPAGDGYLSFYEFGRVPEYLGGIGLLNVPGSGGLLANRLGRIHRIGPLRYGGALSGGATYTDNVFGAQGGAREGDLIWSLTPNLFLEAGNRGTVRLLYSPSLQQYTRFTSRSTINQTLLGSFSLPFQKLAIDGNLAYTSREGVFSDSQGIANQTTVAGGLRASYVLGPRTTLGMGYSFSVQESDPGGQLFTNSLQLSAGYLIGPRTTVNAFLTPGYSSGTVEQPYVSAGVGATWRASARIQLFGDVGLEFRNLGGSSSSSLVSPIFNGGVAWSPREWLSFRANLFRTVRNNAFQTSQTNINTGGGIGGSILLWRRLTLGLDGSLAITEQLSDTDEVDQRYAYGSLSASASYPIFSALSVNAYYTYRVRSSISGSDTGYDQSYCGVSFTLAF